MHDVRNAKQLLLDSLEAQHDSSRSIGSSLGLDSRRYVPTPTLLPVPVQCCCLLLLVLIRCCCPSCCRPSHAGLEEDEEEKGDQFISLPGFSAPDDEEALKAEESAIWFRAQESRPAAPLRSQLSNTHYKVRLWRVDLLQHFPMQGARLG